MADSGKHTSLLQCYFKCNFKMFCFKHQAFQLYSESIDGCCDEHTSLLQCGINYNCKKFFATTKPSKGNSTE